MLCIRNDLFLIRPNSAPTFYLYKERHFEEIFLFFFFNFCLDPDPKLKIPTLSKIPGSGNPVSKVLPKAPWSLFIYCAQERNCGKACAAVHREDPGAAQAGLQVPAQPGPGGSAPYRLRVLRSVILLIILVLLAPKKCQFCCC